MASVCALMASLRNVKWNAATDIGRAEVFREDIGDDGELCWISCGEMSIYGGHFHVTEKKLDKDQANHWLALNRQFSWDDAIELDWAFCTTCHKAQGSEFEKILVIREPWQTEWRWDYTAVTRARSKLAIWEFR